MNDISNSYEITYGEALALLVVLMFRVTMIMIVMLPMESINIMPQKIPFTLLIHNCNQDEGVASLHNF